ncbi:efflux RND transporter periplasmic adaptor subunit [Limnoraphis robusta]|uniref:Efflux RND transporter periplasmic adaptor subunit n=1 Tax=Limnoraphis robusta CCNP1315 TaxID=3110306 RepID=A0ABU5U749_9CYAN|nr:efflux RND transporter periplasmic adaptor subunit [Limnoraphis robusta]MEA5522687.1 efflux RND transporter periplasmic adaptor subunit [Limnoraphis robusta CCNP1315]MEA5547437.1 efflux RND transporter periplasmic adaptor subunit [Limnoraphis robusta CCNP1324]
MQDAARIPEAFPRKWLTLASIALIGIGGVAIYLPLRSPSSEVIPAVTVAPKIQTVTALGRLEPDGEVIKLKASTSTQENRIAELLVKEGDTVEVGEIIAILDSRDRLQAELEGAKEDVEVAKARLEQVKAGAKSGDLAAQEAQISRLQAQLLGDEAAQKATLQRIQAEWEGERNAQEATISRIQAQWEGERNAQEATIGRLRAELNNAEAEYQRYQQLYTEGAISQSSFDSKGLSVETSRQQIAEAEANLERINRTAKEQIIEAEANLERINRTAKEQIIEAEVTLSRIQSTGDQQISQARSQLESLAEVRPVDVQLAQTEVNRAIATVKQAEANLAQVYVRSPQDGVVMDIHTRAGEVVSNEGIVEIGRTQQMYAIAEVYQSDIQKIQLGKTAKITSEALPEILTGTVERIDRKVQQQSVINADPSENIDARVVEVHVRLDESSSQTAAKFTNLQVQVEVQL